MYFLTNRLHCVKRKAIIFCTLFYISTCLGWAQAGTLSEPASATAWIEAMANALHNDNYSQTFIYENQSGISTIKVLHAKLQGHEYSRIKFLNGPYRDFVKKDNAMIMLHTDTDHEINKAAKELPFTEFSKELSNNLKQFYTFSIRGYDRIAGRPCVKIAVLPKDNFSYGYRLCIDRQSHLMLQIELVNANESILDRFLVTQLKPNLALTTENFPWPKNKTVVRPEKHIATNMKTLTPFPWSVGWLPNEGYKIIYTHTTKSPVNDHPVQYALYSNGLFAFSVYVEKDISHVLSQSTETFGATSAVSRVFKTGKNAYYNITVVGELPLGTAERIAASVQTHNEKGIQ